MKKQLILLIGDSGSGKDTTANYLRQKYGYAKIASYTTRPRRKDEAYGDNHLFVRWGAVAHRPDVWCTSKKLTMLTMTYFGGHYYFATREQLTANHKSVYIIDEKGLMRIMDDVVQKGWLDDNFDWQVWHLLRTNNDTDAERKLRDQDRMDLPEEMYAHTIRNDYDMDYLYSCVDAIMKSATAKEVREQENE